MAEWGDRGGFRASPHKFTAETPRSYFKCIEVLNYFDHFDSEETDAGMVVAAFFFSRRGSEATGVGSDPPAVNTGTWLGLL